MCNENMVIGDFVHWKCYSLLRYDFLCHMHSHHYIIDKLPTNHTTKIGYYLVHTLLQNLIPISK